MTDTPTETKPATKPATKPLPSWLPPGGKNLFQEVKRMCTEAEAAGVKLIRLSIGQPAGAPLEAARKGAAEAIMSDSQAMHEYQDNGEGGCPGFSRSFIRAHTVNDIKTIGGDGIDFLPIPGIKPMLGLIPLACGGSDDKMIRVVTTTNPGYPTPADWCRYLSPNVEVYSPELSPANNFRLTIAQIEELPEVDLLMLNYPHNPSGQIMTAEEWHKVCSYCEHKNIRIFNDAAYAVLAHSPEHCTLADVAIDYPGLSWIEAFSCSKVKNMCGWRIAAMIGSSDFIGDVKTIKGNTDSGFAAPLAAGVLKAFTDDRNGITAVQQMYKRRLGQLIMVLGEAGMQLAVEPGAGFFSIWKLPKEAFGEEIASAEQFNRLMIKNTGIVGVHFHPYIRYAVCGDIEPVISQIAAAFQKAAVKY